MISFRHKGDYSKASRYFQRIKDAARLKVLEKYGQAGVAALSAETPVDSGTTAASWGFQVERSGGYDVITFTNSNINKGVNIAIILQYGHGTGTGGYVQGRDYINPAIRPVFDNIANEVWEEVTKI